MKNKYIIRLLAEERQRLTDLVRKGKEKPRKAKPIFSLNQVPTR